MNIKINIKGLFSKLLIIAIIVLNIWFVCQILSLLPLLAFEPVALIGGWFTFTTGELWALATIKKRKIKNTSPVVEVEDSEE